MNSTFIAALGVTDFDNDGDVEIVVVSTNYGNRSSPTMQVIRDKEDRRIQARRIWNQQTHHMTNISSDSRSSIELRG